MNSPLPARSVPRWTAAPWSGAAAGRHLSRLLLALTGLLLAAELLERGRATPPLFIVSGLLIGLGCAMILARGRGRAG